MKSTSYKIKLRGTIGNTTAVPTSIAWINGSDTCLVTPCYKENDYIVVELIPDCVGSSCIEGYVQFGDTCANCEPLYFKRCFCSVDADCPSGCENCNKYGICQSKCLVGEFCAGDTCCECNATTPCTGNKICNGCKCVCPQGTFDKDGICVECDQNTILDKCHVCVNGTIVAVPCDGACDPSTGNCVDCLTGGDCSSRTDGKTCCINKQCSCCAGTVWNTTLEICVSQPCVSDAACGDPCLKCTPEGCKPITCPPNHRCYKGECVYWPCTSASCENGADCGKDCGCVVFEGIKQCVPCHILECEGLCKLALGCECKGADVCGPIDNCEDYCDGTTPCLDPNCTCYNNRCVSCKNFPCPTDCATHYNCGCNANNECGGNKCNDEFTLKKNENCDNPLGCELIAEYTSTSNCGCDPIEFRIKANDNCNVGVLTTDTVFSLNVEIFKNNIPYKDYLSALTIGDNELVQGTLITTITSEVKNEFGIWIPATTSGTPVTSVSIIDNVIPNINLRRENFGFIGAEASNTNRRSKIEVRATNVQIEANDCKKYNNKVIATYEVDFSNPSLVCTQVNAFKIIKNTFVNDNTSSRKPLFIWSKSTTGTFENTKFDNTTGVYAQSGWFRKEYGTKVGTKWIDKINNPKDYNLDVNGELWNNYNYKVKIDCGCKSNDATLQKVIFCCPKDITYKIEECGKKITVSPFNTCDVNKKLPANTTNYKIPVEVQTYYWMVINDNLEKLLVPTGGNLTNNYVFTHSEAITDIRFEQRYNGTPLVPVACPINYTNTPDLPEFNPSITCNPTSIEVLKSTHPNLTKVTATKISGVGVGTFRELFNDSTKFILLATTKVDPLLGIGVIKLTATFSTGCVVTKDITITGDCVSVIATPEPSVYAKGNCSGGGSNPNIVAEVTGFGPNVEYSIDGINFQTSNIFTGKLEGTYTITARETVDGTQYVATTTTQVLPAKTIQAVLSKPTICAGQTSSLTITAEPGITIAVNNPNGVLIANHTFASSTYVINGLNIPGKYTVTVTNVTSDYCSSPAEVILSVGGQVLTPSITITPGCIGTPIPFTIFDNNVGATYILTSNFGTVTTPLQAGVVGYYTPTTVNGSITISGAADSCNTVTPIITTVNGNTASPVIVGVTKNCVLNTHTIVATITGATYVTIGGMPITGVGNVYTKTGVTGSSVEIEASNGTCTTIRTEQLQNCDCPVYTSQIIITPPTCGQGSQNISFVSYAPIAIGKTYQLQKNISGLWTNITGTNYSGTIPSSPGLVPTITVNNTIGVFDEYRMIIYSGDCTTESANTVTTEAVLNEAILIQAPDGNTSVFNGTTGTPYAFTAIGTQPGTTYTWSGVSGINSGAETSNSVTFTTAGTYTITLNTLYTGCPNSATISVIIEQNCTGTISVSGNVPGPCGNAFALVSGGSGVLTYAWYVDNILEPTLTTNTFAGNLIPSGDSVILKAIVTDANGCTGQVEIPYTRCAGEFTLDLATAGPWSDNPTNFYAFLTDIRDNTGRVYWSGTGNVSGNGAEEYMLYHNTLDTGCASNLAVVEEWFGSSRTMVANIAALASSLQTEFNARGADFYNVSVTGVGTVLTFSGLNCLTNGLRATVYWGDTDGSCGIENVNKLGINGTILSNTITC